MVDYVVIIGFPERRRWFGQSELVAVSERFTLAFVVLCVVVYCGVFVACPDEVGSYDGFNERSAPPPGAAHDAREPEAAKIDGTFGDGGLENLTE